MYNYNTICQSKTFKTIYRLLEALFLGLAGLYLFYRTARITTFNLPWPSGFEKHLLTVMAVVAVLRLLSTPLKRKETPIALGLALIYILVYRSDGYRFLLYLAVLTVGFIDIDYRKILKVYLLSVGIVYCAAVLAGMMGLITNYVYTRPGRGVRSAWGICYPTDFASLGLFLLMALWIACRKLPDWAMLVLCAGFILVSRYIAYSWNGVLCGAVFFLTIVYCMLERRVIDRNPKLRWIKNGVDWFETLAFPLFALTMFALMALYTRGTGVGYRLDNLLSRRLSLAVASWQEHGLTPFGTPFAQHGNGFSTFPSSNYNFVDSSYPLILLRYGWVLLIALCLCWGWTARKAIHCGDRRLALVLGVIAVHSFAEHHFIECHFNILLVMPLAAYSLPASEKAVEEQASTKMKKSLSVVVTAILCVTVLFLSAPVLLSWIKTVLEAKSLIGSKDTAWTLFGILLGLMVVSVLIVWGLYRFIRAALLREPKCTCRPALITLALCAAIGIGAWIYADRVINTAAAENADLVEADREALEIAVKAASGKVYSGVLPAVYTREIEGVSYSNFFGDDLSRHCGDTVLMPCDSERNVFFYNNYLYVQISNEHALYTGDDTVIEALTEAGYRATGYYSTVREVSLYNAALNNKLKYDENKGLRLNKEKHQLKKGPYYNLYDGKYTVTYELSLPKNVRMSEDIICTLSITTEKGSNVLLEKDITGNQFDADRKLSMPIEFSVGDVRNVTFGVRVAKKKEVYIEHIQFARTPDLDVHTYYDSMMQVIREVYMGTDGHPIANSLGYAEYRREYAGSDIAKEAYYDEQGELVNRRDTGYAIITMRNDRKKRRIEEHYFGTDSQPILVAEGYSSFYKQYDKADRVVSVAFYGTDGNPINGINGYSKDERVYDQEGHVVVRRFYGADGKTIVSANGYAEIRRTYAKGQLTSEAYYGVDSLPMEQPGGYVAIAQEWDGENLLSRTYLGIDNEPINRTDGYAKVLWNQDGNGVWNASFWNLDGTQLDSNGFNLARNIHVGENGWSEWMIPNYNSENSTFCIGDMNLGEKTEGDEYTCQVEIEFKGISITEGKQFLFQTQGAVDGHWKVGNIWYPNIVYMESAPSDGVYQFVSTVPLNESEAMSNEFEIGFRCDNWASGMFRVRNVKVEKGKIATDWRPGP